MGCCPGAITASAIQWIKKPFDKVAVTTSAFIESSELSLTSVSMRLGPLLLMCKSQSKNNLRHYLLATSCIALFVTLPTRKDRVKRDLAPQQGSAST